MFDGVLLYISKMFERYCTILEEDFVLLKHKYCIPLTLSATIVFWLFAFSKIYTFSSHKLMGQVH